MECKSVVLYVNLAQCFGSSGTKWNVNKEENERLDDGTTVLQELSGM